MNGRGASHRRQSTALMAAQSYLWNRGHMEMTGLGEWDAACHVLSGVGGHWLRGR